MASRIGDGVIVSKSAFSKLDTIRAREATGVGIELFVSRSAFSKLEVYEQKRPGKDEK